jgi:LuxR family maltose regulon positive regulatory protein
MAPAGAPEDAWHTDETLGYVGLLARLTLARLCIMQGRRDEAATLLRRLLGRAEAGDLMGCVLEILALQARMCWEQEYLAQAMIALSRALALAEPLSARERELLHLLAAGLSTPEIATQLFLTTGTVRNHLKSIYRKLAVHSRLQAVERARALGLV